MNEKRWFYCSIGDPHFGNSRIPGFFAKDGTTLKTAPERSLRGVCVRLAKKNLTNRIPLWAIFVFKPAPGDRNPNWLLSQIIERAS